MKTRTLPSGRAIRIALVGALAVAAASPAGAMLWILLLVAMVWLLVRVDARSVRGTFSVERDSPPRVPQGEWATISWTVRAREPGVRALILTENVPESVETKGFEARFQVAPGGIGRERAMFRAMRRGMLALGPGVGRVLGPRGLGWCEIRTADAVELRVDPPVDSLRRLSVDTSRARWQGGRTRRLRGIGSEFESLRDYRPDDDSRWIDWEATARRRKLTSREYQVDEHQSVVFLLDTGRLMATEDRDRSKLDYALGAALAIGFAAMTRGDNVGLIAFDRRVNAELKPGRGRGQSVRLHEALARLTPSLVEPDYADAFARLQKTSRKRSLVLVFTDLVDERVSHALIRAALAASRRHLVVVVTLSDRALLEHVGRPPQTIREAYENAVACDALLLREQAINRLKGAGVRVVDSPADRLAGDVVETYLRLRMENRV
jgi:uncharacterized protein (DUF58 family)